MIHRLTILSSSIIAGRVVKNEYLALGTLGLTGLLASMAMGGGKKEKAVPGNGKQTLEQVKDTVKIDASSRCVAIRAPPSCFAHVMLSGVLARRSSCTCPADILLLRAQ